MRDVRYREGESVATAELWGRSVRTCTPTDRLSDVARVMRDEECGCLLVISEADPAGVAGIVTDRDLCMTAYAGGKRLDELHVRDAMSTEVGGFQLADAYAVAETASLHGDARTLALVDQEGEVMAFLTLFGSGAGGGGQWRSIG